MKTSIIIILGLTLLTSCGKHNRSSNRGNVVNPVVNHSLYYVTCSYAQVQQNCLDQSSNGLIAPRFFYYRACYQSYTNCLRSNGINIPVGRY